MRALANILWHVPFLGFLNAFFTFLLGSLLVITIVAAPIGLGLIEFSKFLLTPFSSQMIDKRDLDRPQNTAWAAYSFLVRIVYFPFGLILAIFTVVEIVGLCISIIGIPMAVILAKSLGTYFNPVHKKSVPRIVAQEVQTQKARRKVGV